MLRICLILSVCVVLCINSSISQVVYNDKEPFIAVEDLSLIAQSAQSMLDSIIDSGLNSNRVDIIEIQDETFILPDGTFDVFKLVNGVWTNMYDYGFKGYNLGSKKFVYNEELYSFGGYGYWNNHGQIIHFLESRGRWELLPFSQELKNGICIFSNPILTAFTKDSILEINLDTRKINSVPNNQIYIDPESDDNLNSKVFELKSYSFKLGQKPYLAFDRTDGVILESKLNPFSSLKKASKNGVVHLKGDSLICYSDQMTLLGRHHCSEELNFFNQIETLHQINSKSKPKSHIVLIITILSLLLATIWWFYKTKYQKSNNLQASHKTQLSPLLLKLQEYKGQVLSQESLDQILEISTIQSGESKRFRRSQIIKELNNECLIQNIESIINRQRDPKDGRRYIYRIAM